MVFFMGNENIYVKQLLLINKKMDLMNELLIEVLKENSPRTIIKYYNDYEELLKYEEEM